MMRNANGEKTIDWRKGLVHAHLIGEHEKRGFQVNAPPTQMHEIDLCTPRARNGLQTPTFASMAGVRDDESYGTRMIVATSQENGCIFQRPW
jgi:hypothetical protein